MFHEQTVRSRMDKTIESLHQRIESLQLNGEVTPDMLRSVRVFAYGTQCSLDHMAMVASQDDNTLIVEPFDQSQISIIGRALINCPLALRPWKDRNRWIVEVEMPTAEDRQKRLQYVKTIAEEQKVAIRQIRREFRKKWDDCDRKLDQLTKEYTEKIDQAVNRMTTPG